MTHRSDGVPVANNMPPSVRLGVIFTGAAHAALVTLTVTGAALFTDVRCPCGGKIMAIPGVVRTAVRVLASPEDATGRGRIVMCHRHAPRRFCEVIEDG
jgi:hypothetical protein